MSLFGRTYGTVLPLRAPCMVCWESVSRLIPRSPDRDCNETPAFILRNGSRERQPFGRDTSTVTIREHSDRALAPWPPYEGRTTAIAAIAQAETAPEFPVRSFGDHNETSDFILRNGSRERQPFGHDMLCLP